MSNLSNKQNDSSMPLIVFKVGDMLCAVDGACVVSIQRMEQYTLTPHTPPEIFGSMEFRSQVISILDLRTVFGLPTRTKEYNDFVAMLEQRKQDHIRWVETLKETSVANKPFPLATCPHQCTFGKWYDKYTHPNKKIMFHLEKIREPHEKLHHAALDIAKCQQNNPESKEDIQAILQRAENEYMLNVVNLLESAKTIFKDVYQTMLVVLEEVNQIAVAVDEVVAVTYLEEVAVERENLINGNFIKRFLRGKDNNEIIYHLNHEALFDRIIK